MQVRLRASVEDFINEGAAPAERMIRDLVDCEHAYINTDHPQFIGGNRALSQVCVQSLVTWISNCKQEQVNVPKTLRQRIAFAHILTVAMSHKRMSACLVLTDQAAYMYMSQHPVLQLHRTICLHSSSLA